MADEAQGKAIPFVALENGKFNLTAEATEFLSQIDYPVSVIAVVGLYRTGKSFLMNRILLDDSDGFQVGPTVNPCTKGLWVWNKVMTGTNKEGETVKYIVVDTEGIGALDTNSQHDSIIFSLALLLSSYFIYNSVGSIDEGALNNLSLVVNLTKHIHVKSTSGAGGEDDGAEFAQYFPAFLWLVRDFTLQLVTPDGQAFTSKEYLERALQPAPGFTEQIEAKNRIRRMLTHFFPDRDCFTMVRPVTDESMLQRLNGIPATSLRPEFQAQMLELRKLIMSRAEPKRMNSTALDGVALVNLAQAYTQSINTGSVPSILNAWSYICESKCQHALNEAFRKFEAEVKSIRDELLPLPNEELDDCIRELQVEAWATFNKHAIGSDTEGFKKQLADKMSTAHRQLQADNIALGREKAKETLEKLYAPVDMKLQEDGYATFDEYELERKKVRAAYMDEIPAGPAKIEVLAAFMEAKLSDCSSRFQSKFSMELQKTKAQAKSDVDEAQRQLLTTKMEAEKEMGSVKLKLEYAEKYNEDAKLREKESREEISRLRTTHEAAIKELRDKADQELKSQVSALEEKRSKAVQEAQQAEQAFIQLKKDQEKQQALLEQEKQFANKSAADALARETDLRKMLESAKRDAEAEIKQIQDRLESDLAAKTKLSQQLTEEMERTTEQLSDWKNKHAALGVQLSIQIQQLQADLDNSKRLLTAAQDKVLELEAEGGKKAVAEKEQLSGELEALRLQYDEVVAQKQEMSNKQMVANEVQDRLKVQLEDMRKELRRSEDKVEELSGRLNHLENEHTRLAENEKTKAEQVGSVSKALEDATKERDAIQKNLSDTLSATKEQLEALQRHSSAQISELEKTVAERVSELEEVNVTNRTLREEVETLQTKLKELEESSQQGMTTTEEQWRKKLTDAEDKYRKKVQDMNAASERTQQEMKHGFQNEKEAMEARIRSLEKQAAEDKEHAANEIREYESAMDELENSLKADMAQKEKAYEKKIADMEKEHLSIKGELQKTMEGQTSRISMLEQQISDIKSQYKEEKQDMENKHNNEMKVARNDADIRINKLEQDLSNTTLKYETASKDLVEAQKRHASKVEELTNSHAATIEGLEQQHKREKEELQKVLQDVSAQLKQSESSHMIAEKDFEMKKELLERQIKQYEKLLEDREAVVRNLEHSKESEISEMRSKLNSNKQDDEAKMNREREDAKAKFDDLKNKSDEKIRTLKEQLNQRQTELKVLEERIDGYKASEAKAAAAIADYKARMQDQKESSVGQIKELKEQLSQTQKELQEERSEHQMMKLRAEKKEEWDKREIEQLKEEMAEKKKLMDSMISKDIYKRDMDAHKSQHQTALAEVMREKEAERLRLEADKKRLDDELNKAMASIKKYTSEGANSEAKQREMEKHRAEKDRLSKELEEAKRDLDSLRKQSKAKDDELKKKDTDLLSANNMLKPMQNDLQDLKRERDELETKVMKLEMELKNIQQIEERKYQVDIMRLKTENEELKRADKKKQMIEPKTPMDNALDAAQPALTSALARVRARRTTAQGSAAGAAPK